MLAAASDFLFFLHNLHLPFQTAPGNLLCHHNKHLMRHFEIFHGSWMTCLSLAESIITFRSVNTTRHPLILKNNINHSSKREPLPFFHSNINAVLGSHSSQFCWQKPCFGCDSGINLVVLLE